MVTSRAAKALAAFENREEVTSKDIYTIVSLCLRHRLRKDPLESIDSGFKVQETFKKVFNYE
jgi:magnesium chelatase subunit I